jgi:hypothetical protein
MEKSTGRAQGPDSVRIAQIRRGLLPARDFQELPEGIDPNPGAVRNRSVGDCFARLPNFLRRPRKAAGGHPIEGAMRPPMSWLLTPSSRCGGRWLTRSSRSE